MSEPRSSASRSDVPDPLVAIGSALEGPELRAYEEYVRLSRLGRPVALVSVIGIEGSAPRGMGAAMAVREDGSIVGTVGGGSLEKLMIEAARQSLADGRPRRFHYDFTHGAGQNIDKSCMGKTDFFVQPSLGRPRLLVFGAGHVGAALAPMAASAGFAVTLVDDREGYPREEDLGEGIQVMHAELREAVDRLGVDESTYVVIVTYGHHKDQIVLEACLHRPWAYLGLIGSKAKVALAFKELGDDPATQARIERVHAPVGLDLGGRSPGELAVSIVAELVAVRHGRQKTPSLREINGHRVHRTPRDDEQK